MVKPPVYVAVAVYPLAPATGSQVTVTVVEEEEEALTLVGVDRGVTGSEGVEESEDAVVPFVATTVNVYVVPAVKPFTVIWIGVDGSVGAAKVPVNPSGEEVAVYEVAPNTAAVSVTVAEVDAMEETLEITGVARLVPVRTKGVFEVLTLVQTVPEPGYVVGSPVRIPLAAELIQEPEG